MKEKLLKVLADLVNTPKPITKVRLNTQYQVSYLAGYSEDGLTIYIDRRLPQYFKLKDGRVIDVYKYLMVHELWEKHLEDTKGYSYSYSHEKATGKEREAVEKDGIPWKEYQSYMLKMVKKLTKLTGEVPPDLDVKPEKDNPPNIKMLREIIRFQHTPKDCVNSPT